MSYIDGAVRILDTSGTLAFDASLAAGYHIVSISEGALTWRRATATSRFVNGAAQTAATLDMTTAVIVWLVEGATPGQVRGRIAALREALKAFQFRTEVTIEGVTEVWDCWAADMAVDDGGRYLEHRVHNNLQGLTATIPRQPVPLSVSGLT